MKTTIKIFITFLLISNITKAQMPSPGSYITNNTMGAFHGTWQWTSGTDTVKIYLETKKVYIDGDNYYIDLLVGWHLYKKGATVIESSFSNINNVNVRTINLWDDGTPNSTKVQGTIDDLTRTPRYNNIYLTLNASQNQIIWRCTKSGQWGYAPGQTIPPAGITLPINMLLIKQ
jgi:hypothetical protein